MDTLSTVILALLTVVSPLAISRAKNDSWSKTVKVGVPVLVATVLALVYLFVTGSITQGGDVITTILMVYGAQQLAYTTIMRWWAEILEQRGQPTPEAVGATSADVTIVTGGRINLCPERSAAADIRIIEAPDQQHLDEN